ncbi:Uncharacterized protein APZ42_029949 [Daphnia magna]|uniref:Uncharacterized protein n=1 Tax=Daphnia magna TaxID=35525 RepID=A0A164P656_9CRUS|nr:Uncharacterized protein APZ42_029949 [Daphnia magna]
MTMDGGPNENPRYQKTIQVNDLHALFVATNTPGKRAFNQVERKIEPLSRELSGRIISHDRFCSHLDERRCPIDEEFEMQNVALTGEILAEIWSQLIVDKFPTVASYINPSVSEVYGLSEYMTDTKPLLPQILLKATKKEQTDMILVSTRSNLSCSSLDILLPRLSTTIEPQWNSGRKIFHREPRLRKSFLGMTIHWIADDMERQSYCLAIRRIQGTCDYDVLARLIESIHEEYDITLKVVTTVTDNGSNFVKAFRLFSTKESTFGCHDQFQDWVNESIYGNDDTAIASFSGTDSPQKKKNSTELNALDRYINDERTTAPCHRALLMNVCLALLDKFLYQKVQIYQM